jgi:hypothetical protein
LCSRALIHFVAEMEFLADLSKALIPLLVVLLSDVLKPPSQALGTKFSAALGRSKSSTPVQAAWKVSEGSPVGPPAGSATSRRPATNSMRQLRQFEYDDYCSDYDEDGRYKIDSHDNVPKERIRRLFEVDLNTTVRKRLQKHPEYRIPIQRALAKQGAVEFLSSQPAEDYDPAEVFRALEQEAGILLNPNPNPIDLQSAFERVLIRVPHIVHCIADAVAESVTDEMLYSQPAFLPSIRSQSRYFPSLTQAASSPYPRHNQYSSSARYRQQLPATAQSTPDPYSYSSQGSSGSQYYQQLSATAQTTSNPYPYSRQHSFNSEYRSDPFSSLSPTPTAQFSPVYIERNKLQSSPRKYIWCGRHGTDNCPCSSRWNNYHG